MNTKYRLVLVDNDIDYLIPLQIKIAGDYSENAEVEIITEKNYLNEFFSVPQEIDILIISDELLDDFVSIHNIANIFVLVDNDVTIQKSQLYNTIYRYSSVKEILSVVFGKSVQQLRGKVKANVNNKKKSTKVILVYSGKGGEGKTTIALGLSASLTDKYKNTLYIDASSVQTFQCFINDKSPISDNTVYSKLNSNNIEDFSILGNCIKKESFFFLPPFKAPLLSLGLTYDVYVKIIRYFKATSDFDFIIVDANSSFCESIASLIDISDLVMIVTKQNYLSAYSVNRLVSNMNITNSGKFIFLCNDFEQEFDNFLIDNKLVPNVSINEYIHHISNQDVFSINKLSNNLDLQKLTYLLI